MKKLLSKHKLLFTFLALGIVYLIFTLTPPADRKVIPGKYYYTTDKLESTIKINKDNTYNQVVISKATGEAYLYDGSWQPKYKLITFEGETGEVLDWNDGTPLDSPENVYGAQAIIWKDLLVFNADYSYTFKRQQ